MRFGVEVSVRGGYAVFGVLGANTNGWSEMENVKAKDAIEES